MTIQQACQILQVSQDATFEQAKSNYDMFRADLREKQFQAGSVGNDASQQLDLLEDAIEEFRRFDRERNNGSGSAYFNRIEEYIKNGDLNTAQEMLDDTNDRGAEWHYIQSIIYYKKNWYIESKKQLELCVNMEPQNTKYSDSLAKLTKILASKTVSPDKLSGENASRPVNNDPYQGGGNGTCTGSCCGDICLANMCCDCCRCFSGF